MQNISSKDAQNHFGDLMTTVIKGPVVIKKYGKPAAVLMSHEEYERLEKLEDLYWIMQANTAAKEGFLSKDDSEDFLDKTLKE